MSISYIRYTYLVPAKRGGRVRAAGKPGVIVGAHDAWLRVRLDGEKRPRLYHPTWEMVYIANEVQE